MGEKSCVNTWKPFPILTDEQAEEIVILGAEIVKPELPTPPLPIKKVAKRNLGRWTVLGAVGVLVLAYYGRPYLMGERNWPVWIPVSFRRLGWYLRMR